jgi:hypothetical protein
VERTGKRTKVVLDDSLALSYATITASAFRVGVDREVAFSAKLAREDLDNAKKEQKKKKKDDKG